jgi:hypothetical protein
MNKYTEKLVMNDDELNRQAYVVNGVMRNMGGSFVAALGQIIKQADMTNLRKIHDTWPQEWQEYWDIGQQWYATHDRLGEESHHVDCLWCAFFGAAGGRY